MIEGLSREDAFKFFDEIIKGWDDQREVPKGAFTIAWKLTDFEDRKVRAYITARDALNPKAIEREKDMDNMERAKDEARAVAAILREARNGFKNRKIITIKMSAKAADYLVESLEALANTDEQRIYIPRNEGPELGHPDKWAGVDFYRWCKDNAKANMEDARKSEENRKRDSFWESERMDVHRMKGEVLTGGPRDGGRTFALLDYFRGYSDAKMNQPDPCIREWIIGGIIETFEQLDAVLVSVGLVERIKEAQHDIAKALIDQALPKTVKGGGPDVK